MSVKVINTHYAKTNLSKLLSVVVQGRQVLIGRNGVPVAKLVPFHARGSKRIGGQLKGKVHMANDFDKLPKKFLASFEHFERP
jgi:prevent-host-death family protein